MNKEDLKSLLNMYDDAYYNNDMSLITDFEYDALKNEYVSKYGEYDYVPGEAKADSTKYTHRTNVSSLGKLQISDEDGIRRELERLWPVAIQEKMDGLTMVTYGDEDVTRGNGHVGEIVTENAKNIDGRGERLLTFPIRSEVVMLHSEFNRLNNERTAQGLDPFENCRNAAAGMLRQKDPSKVQGLKVFAYNLLFDELEPDDIEESEGEDPNANAQLQIETLRSLGWNTVNSYVPESIDDAMEYIKNYDRTTLDFDIDGLVIKHIGSKLFGETSHHPLNAVAVKFAPEGGWTTLKDIEWSVGRTGKVVPTAIFEPISILGSTVTRATLHNIGIINALGLTEIMRQGKYGDSLTRIFVIKANDVIPAIIEVEQPAMAHNMYSKGIFEPTLCPDCNSELRKEGDQIFCDNESCGSRVLNRLIHLAGRDYFNIEDLGEETAIKLIAKYKHNLEVTLTQIMNTYEVLTEADDCDGLAEEEELVENKLRNLHPSFIYELTLDDIKSLEGFAEKSATKLYNEIQKSKYIEFDKFLAGCGIPLVGRRAARDIAEFYCTPDGPEEMFNFVNDYYDGFKQLSKLRGIGPETIASLIKYYDSYIVPFGEYGLRLKDVTPKKKAENQMSIVVTGAFEKTRDEIKAMIEDAGHKMAGSVSKSTAYLLAAPGEESTGKYTKAIEIGTTIIHTLEELEEIL